MTGPEKTPDQRTNQTPDPSEGSRETQEGLEAALAMILAQLAQDTKEALNALTTPQSTLKNNQGSTND